ncbi:hypothetical protein ACP4OV_030626 [Aristida adscensionis]
MPTSFAFPSGPIPGAAVAGGRSTTPRAASFPFRASSPLVGAPSAGGGILDVGGAAPAVALPGVGASPARNVAALYEAALRFFRGREGWPVENPADYVCIGSRQEPTPSPRWKYRWHTSSRIFQPTPYLGRVSSTSEKKRENKLFLLHILQKANDHEVANLEQMYVERQVAKLMAEFSCSGGHVTGEGTLVMACSLLEEAKKFLMRGINPLKIAKSYEEASRIVVDCLEQKCRKFCNSSIEHLVQACMTTLPSEIITNSKQILAEIAFKVVLAVADIERNHVHLDLVKVQGKVRGKIDDSNLIYGIVVDKDMSDPKMPMEIVDARIAILTCSFEFSNPKMKYNLPLDIVDIDQKSHEQEPRCFVEIVQKCKDVGATLVLCQWGFDDEVNHIFMNKNLPAIRWVDRVDLELIALATGGRVVPRFQELSPEDLGKAGLVRVESFGRTIMDRMFHIEQCANPRAITILIRGGDNVVIEETKRIIRDTFCVAKNLIQYYMFPCTHASLKVSCSAAIEATAHQYPKAEEVFRREACYIAIMSFADILYNVPLPSAENHLPLVGMPTG